MNKKVRVHELAKEFAMPSSDLLQLLREQGESVASHMAAISDDVAARIRDQLRAGKVPTSEKPVLAATEAAMPAAQPAPIPKSKGKAASTVHEPAAPPTPAPAATPVPTAAKPSRAAATPPRAPRGKSSPIPATASSGPKTALKEVHLRPPIIVKELASALEIKANELIHDLLQKNIFATINQAMDVAVAEEICKRRGFVLVAEKREKAVSGAEAPFGAVEPEDVVYDDEQTESRPPVVTFMGHVDHGKTSLLDKIRKSRVAAGEAGGITQHIGASSIEWQNHRITFIDTPGHEAFTAMRARGANTTDLVVLVVAADDGVMPQTLEAISHAKAANVSMIVAINKVDLPAADVLRVQTQLQTNGIVAEEWGGHTGMVQVSATTGKGVDELLDRVLLEAEMLELKANPKLPVKAVVLESQLEQGQGATVNVLVKNGTVHVGDNVLCGRFSGRVKALVDHHGNRVQEAGPSTAVKLVGLSGVPDSGTLLVGCDDEREAKKFSEERETKLRESQLQPRRHASLDDLFRQIEEDARKDLNVIVKTDVQGTGEAVLELLKKLESPKIKVKVIHAGVGSITENDVLLAAASDAIIVGFHVRVNPGVNALARKEGVDIRLYSIIYELAEQIKEAMTGLLEPELREEKLGTAQILQIFTLSKVGKICGCSVTKGVMIAGAKARVFRGQELIYNGSIQSLKRFQDDVKEVRQGFECGIRLDNFNDFEVGDVVDAYEYKSIAATL